MGLDEGRGQAVGSARAEKQDRSGGDVSKRIQAPGLDRENPASELPKSFLAILGRRAHRLRRRSDDGRPMRQWALWLVVAGFGLLGHLRGALVQVVVPRVPISPPVAGACANVDEVSGRMGSDGLDA